MATLLTDYPTSNQSKSFYCASDQNTGVAQTFSVSGNYSLAYFQLYLEKTGTPSGAITVSIYSVTGGSGSQTPNTLIANSTISLDASSLTTSYTLYTFNFSGVNLVSGTTYMIVMTFSGGGGSNYVKVGVGNSSVSGNSAFYVSSWNTTSTYNLCYYVYGNTIVTSGNFLNFF